jgi:hypothetical protein
MSDRLTELQSKRNADERFLSHRETHELLRLQEREIERLRDKVTWLIAINRSRFFSAMHTGKYDEVTQTFRTTGICWECTLCGAKATTEVGEPCNVKHKADCPIGDGRIPG